MTAPMVLPSPPRLRTVPPEAVTPPTLEMTLAEQANDAMKAGADPHAATERLGTLLTHVRAHPDLAQQAQEAIAQGADPHAVTGRIWQHAQQASPAQPGVLSRAGSKIGDALTQVVTHPIDSAVGMAKSAGQSLYDTFAAGVKGEELHSDLAMLHNRGVVKQDEGVTPQRFVEAGAQTVANAAFPTVAGGIAGRLGGGALARAAGLATAGGVAGAATDPSDPVASGLAGAVLAPVIDAGGRGLGRGARLAGRGASAIGEKVLDDIGRPDASRPVVTVAGKPLGRIASVGERAAQINDAKLGPVEVPESDKPLAPIDASIQAQRLGRGLKTSSPAAETVLRDALQGRAAGAVDRVIQHGLETTGLTSRENGLGVVDDMIAQRRKTGNETYQPLFQQHDNVPLTDPEYDRIARTHSGQIALKRGTQIASDRGEKIGSVDAMTKPPAPPGFSDEQWSNVLSLAKERGTPIPMVEGGAKIITPTLRQAHYMKLGFDDLINSGAEPGEGGSGPNLRAGRIQLKNELLAQMDKDVPKYGQIRKVSADQADLVNGAKLGRELFKMHPQEAARAMADLPKDAQDVARRTGFDALAERVENGPADVERNISKPRDMKRMRLLFPDDASFEQFKAGLKQEGQMHATTQAVLGGPNTADKLADMASMAGVTLPDVLAASTGHIGPLVKKGIQAARRNMTTASGDRLAAERAKLLVTGANGTRLRVPPTP